MKTYFVWYSLFLTVVIHSALATTLYVDLNNQTGREDGSQARPYNTIQEGIDNASEGNTILVLPGVYRGLGNVEITSSKSVTLKSKEGHNQTVIDGSNLLSLTAISEDFNGILEGFTVQNFGYGLAAKIEVKNCVFRSNVIGITTSARPIKCTLDTNIIGAYGIEFIENSQITNNSICGIYSPSLSITNCVVANNGRQKSESTFSDLAAEFAINNMNNYEYKIRSRELHISLAENDLGGGICILDGSLRILNCTISNNTSKYGGITLVRGKTVKIENSIIWGNFSIIGSQLTFISLPSEYVVSRNGHAINELSGYDTPGEIEVNFCNVENGLMDFSVVKGHYKELIGADPKWLSPVNGNTLPKFWHLEKKTNITFLKPDSLMPKVFLNNISADPLFADPNNNDFRLLPGSPCIDAGGISEKLPENDIAGINRTQGPFPDIGAYEGTQQNISSFSIVNKPNRVLQPRQTFQFQLQGIDDQGDSFNLPSGAANWQVVGEIGKINSSGLFTATTPGSGTIKAILRTDNSIVKTVEVSVAGSGTGLFRSQIPLNAGVNIFSLPLKPETPLSASKLATEIGATVLIRAFNGSFQAYVPEGSFGTDFTLESGSGVIVNLLTAKTYLVTGRAWGEQIAAAPSTTSQTPTWAFVVTGHLSQPLPSNSRLEVVNHDKGLRCWAQASNNGQFMATLIDQGQQAVVSSGDRISIQLRDAEGKLIQQLAEQHLSRQEVNKAVMLAQLEVSPDQTQLYQNYPNPFNPETWLPFQLAEDQQVKIVIYDSQGQLIRQLELGYQTAGWYLSQGQAAYWNGKNRWGEPVSSGTYFYQLDTKQQRSLTRKLLILK